LGRKWIVVSASVGLLIVLGGAAALLLRPKPESTTGKLVLQQRPITERRGVTHSPVLSPDGKLIAYASDRAGETGLDIWVQQLAYGANPIRLTRDVADEGSPEFSPDGSRVVFESEKDGGGIYIMPALGGEQRLVISGPYSRPRFSPDGMWLAVSPPARYNANAFIVPVYGGSRPRRIAEGFVEILLPIWSPDGQHILFYGFTRTSGEDWWIVPANGGAPVPLGVRKLILGDAVATAWIGDYILLTDGDVKRVPIQRNPWRLVGPVESFTSSPGYEGEPAAVPMPGNPDRWLFALVTGDGESTIWRLRMDLNRARPDPAGPQRLLPDEANAHTPSLSADGTRLTYVRWGLKGFEIRARDLKTGDERTVMRTGTQPRARLSPDGSMIAVNAAGVATEPDRVVQIVPWSGEQTRVLCGDCGLVYDWSPDGRRIIYRAGNPMRFYDVDAATRNKRAIASDPQYALAGVMLSPDQRWAAIQYALTANVRPLFVAPVRDGIAAPRQDWIAVMDQPGTHQRPWWSPDGNILYFLSNAAGKDYIWAQRLRAETRQSVGEPFIVCKPPSGRLSFFVGPQFGPGLSRDTIVFQMTESNTQIWVGEQVPDEETHSRPTR
jgi:Tol biopolymer transport system component